MKNLILLLSIGLLLIAIAIGVIAVLAILKPVKKPRVHLVRKEEPFDEEEIADMDLES